MSPQSRVPAVIAVGLLLLVLLASAPEWAAKAALLQGCDFGDQLCEPGEVCIQDGLFGQCYSDPKASVVRPLVLDRALTDVQTDLLRAELARLAQLGLDWPHARAQCVLAYFKLAVAFQLDYDTDFCAVQNPANIWMLVQRVQDGLLAEQAEEGGPTPATVEDEGQSLLAGEMMGQPIQRDQEEQLMGEIGRGEQPDPVELIPVLLLDGQSMPAEEQEQEGMETTATAKLSSANTSADKSAAKRSAQQQEKLNSADRAQLDKLVRQLLENKAPAEETAKLSDGQLSRLVGFIRQLQNVLQANAVLRAEEAEEKAEEEEEKEEQMREKAETEKAADRVLLLKKDSEQFDNADMGLAHTVHKIVKGGIQRVEGNRVYLRVAKEGLTEEELYKLIAYLDRKIARPNTLYFDQFLYEDGQLSFRISRQKPKPETVFQSASGVAQAVYKRRKDIQTLAGVRVDETGIGSGEDVIPVERSQRDRLFVPILAVCAMTICALLAVLGASLIGRIRRQKGAPAAAVLPQTVDKGRKALYEELCRQRAADCPQAVVAVSGGGGDRSKHSSTSSWPGDEPPPADLEIGTAHLLLGFLQRHLEFPEEMARQWESVRAYVTSEAQTTVAAAPENSTKNLDPDVLPYDETRVRLHGSDSVSSLVDMSQPGGTYVNASKIFDSDPAQPTYIASQAPLETTTAHFWQMIWEQGIVLVVNLCDQQETKTGAYAKYWPEEGSKMFGVFEVHLVSEHIWSEHYVVRSLYLKNTATQETRTVTQFHFLSWPSGGIPASNKALLEFRRKVNKSYRGRASPILVHCTNGSGRTGTYILTDMTVNRIQKGVKELNLAASLEHLRDQRMGMVQNERQFKNVFSCVAEEVSSLLSGLRQH